MVVNNITLLLIGSTFIGSQNARLTYFYKHHGPSPDRPTGNGDLGRMGIAWPGVGLLTSASWQLY